MKTSTFSILVLAAMVVPAAAAPQPLRTLEQADPVALLAFSPDGKTIASGGREVNAAVRLWNLSDGKMVAELNVHRAAVTGLVFTPDGKFVVSCGWDTDVYLWDVATGKEVRQFSGHQAGVTGLAMSPDGNRLVSASMDNTVRLWDVATGKEVRRFDVPARNPNREAVLSVTYSPDGTQIAAYGGGQSRTNFHLWEAATGKALSRLPRFAFAFDTDQFLDSQPTDRRLELMARQRKIQLKQTLQIGTLVRHRLAEVGLPLRAFGQASRGTFDAYSTDGRTVAQVDKRVSLIETASGQERLVQARGTPFTFASAVTFAADGQHLAWGDDKGFIHVWHLADLVGAGREPTGELFAKELESAWIDLGGTDAAKAYRTGWVLAGAPKDAVPFLRDKVLNVPPGDRERVENLLADLDSNQFAVRQKACEELGKLGAPAATALQKLLLGRPSLEATRRAEALLQEIEEKLVGELLRALRVVEVLERAGTAEARDALARIARGPTRAGTAVEESAAESLKRLDRAARR
ncbi:MAG: hypothetical protein K2R98_23330 [Gemmataceae bacterium]|nr:hypothetical protein [Gemmataceae bacterium]